MSAKLPQLISSRGNYRGQVNSIHRELNNFVNVSAREREVFTSKIQRLQKELERLDPLIRELKWELHADDARKAEDENNKEISESTTYDDKISECLITLADLKANSSTDVSSIRSKLSSATAPLPKYSSLDTEDLTKFFQEFEDTTERFNYSDYDKFLLLKQQISGRASSLINSLDSVKHSYKEAKKLLLEALASPSVQKFNIIKQMASLNLEYDAEPFEYIGKINSIQKAISTLKISTDDIVQYFAWSGLNETFKNQLVLITNASKPSLDQIQSKFFEANERYLTVQKRFKSKSKSKETPLKKSTGFAASIDFDKSQNIFKSCPLCERSKSSHPIYKCTAFPNPKSKLERLKELKACTKCGKLNHESSDCKFHFRNRCDCGAWHFRFLCSADSQPSAEGNPGSKKPSSKSSKTEGGKSTETKKTSSKTSKPEENSSESTHSGIVCVDESRFTYNAMDCSRAILPTFSCTLQGNDQIRCMRDGGCQSNFIRDERAIKENLPIVKSGVQLKVNGFNTSKVYHTKVYKLNLRIGDEDFEVEAMGIDSIKALLKLPGLSTVVQGFRNKGYNLADKFLNNEEEEIADVEFILGSNYAYCLPETHVSYGLNCNSPSVYSLTPAGVMLVGNIDQMVRNLDYLPTSDGSVVAYRSVVDPSSDHNGISYEDLGIINNPPNLFHEELEATLEVQAHFVVLNEDGEVMQAELQKATNEMLEKSCCDMLNYDRHSFPDDNVESNQKIINYVLKNTIRDPEGRLVMPLVWNNKVDHLLGKNKHLAKQILNSNLKKLSRNNGEYLKMVDENFKEQTNLGIIERIENLDQFLEENPQHSFLAHMGVFKPDRDTTKCRVVFLSNLCERDSSQKATLSHNQAMLSGPCINQKLSTALLHLRFDRLLLCFDIKKAFLNISLSPQDSNKLLFLWYKNVEKGDFSIIGYRSLRLPFGLVCSPCLLLLGLYKILMFDADEDTDELRKLKRHIYSLIYMDNGSITSNDPAELKHFFENLGGIFEPYKFFLQQFVTNCKDIQDEIDSSLTEKTPDCVKLFGLNWNRLTDTLMTKPLQLDIKANTKRLILKTIAGHFDLFGFTLPILNRARLFLHRLQCDKSLTWDSVLSDELLREWRNLCKQANSSCNVEIERFAGKRDSSYRLIAYTDSSKDIYGTVVYIQDLESLKVSFLLAKNRLVNRQLSGKSMPSLEFQGITLGTEVLIGLFQELSGPSCVNPIKIDDLQLFSDSMVCLSWINSYSHKLDKVNKYSVFIRNRLEHLSRLCEVHPINYQFVSGVDYPADLTTREVSYRTLMKSNYISGPNFLKPCPSVQSSREDIWNILVPNPLAKSSEEMPNIECRALCETNSEEVPEHLVLVDRCSGFSKLVSVHKYVLKFVRLLKIRLHNKDPLKYDHLKCSCSGLKAEAKKNIILTEQKINFPEIFSYFDSKNKTIKDIPNLVNQLNVYPDQQGILRVKSKFSRWKNDESIRFPILLPKNSQLTRMIVMEFHLIFSHAGCYRLLSELRRQFWVPHHFSVVKRIIKDCVTCRKIKQRTIKLNQSPYREFRLEPPNIPFRSIFIDHAGPFYVKYSGVKTKVWLLCITCLWSRAINLKLCFDLTTKEFLRSLQLHTFEYGVPQLCLSDLGSSFVAGANIITDFLKDADTQEYLEEHGIKSLTFEQYFKGHHPLGGLVEICVKMVKQMIYCNIKKNVLDHRDFEYLVAHVVHLVNRRPIAFQEGLRDNESETIPDVLTPEKLIHGFDLVSLNLIPELKPDPECDPEWLVNTDPVDGIHESYQKLRKIRSNLIEVYNSEFLSHLMKQAVNDKSRYKPVDHKKLEVGDLVLIKEDNCKSVNYPMAVVKEVKTNINDEVTDVILKKGKNNEIVKRHVTSLIPILSTKEMKPSVSKPHEDLITVDQNVLPDGDGNANQSHESKPKRTAAIESMKKTRAILNE